ncbi:MAG: recombination mediator RecR [Bacillota bacterium]|nr:recombination mediator RecR [Bacillota bacterium]
MTYARPIARLIDQLTRLPGVGPKTAQRLAFHMLGMEQSEVEQIAKSMVDARVSVRRCDVCGDLTDQRICPVCGDPGRERSMICVVERPQDVAAMERTRQYRGLYHVLHGAIAPLDGIGPEQIRIRELVARLQEGTVREVIVATNPDVEGDATALFLADLLRPLGVAVTRLARGLPVGGDLEYADEVTLGKAFEGRREV